MPGAVTIKDFGTDGNPSITGSPDTIINGFAAQRFNDLRSISLAGYYYGGRNVGVHDVYINDRWAQTCGDQSDVSGVQAEGSSDTIIN